MSMKHDRGHLCLHWTPQLGYVGGCLTVCKCTDYMILFKGGPTNSWRMLHDLKTAATAEGLSLISVLTNIWEMSTLMAEALTVETRLCLPDAWNPFFFLVLYVPGSRLFLSLHTHKRLFCPRDTVESCLDWMPGLGIQFWNTALGHFLALTALLRLLLLLLWSCWVQKRGGGHARPRGYDRRWLQTLHAATHWRRQHHNVLLRDYGNPPASSTAARTGGLSGTVHTDVVFVLGHLARHAYAYLVEPLVTAAVTLNPVHLEKGHGQTKAGTRL